MKRSDLRHYIRVLADELTEAPEGLMADEDLNILMDISQNNVALRLAPSLPNKFLENTTFSTVANQGVYNIETDIGITDCLAISDILHNLSGKNPLPLIFVEDIDDKYQYGAIGETGVMRYWGYESKSEIWIMKVPASAEADRFKVYHIKERTDMADDDAAPDLPKSAHVLVAYDVLYQWAMRGGGNVKTVEAIYQKAQDEVIDLLKQNFSIRTGMKPSVKELIKRGGIE